MIRKRILKSLKKCPKTCEELHKEINASMGTIISTLNELRKEGRLDVQLVYRPRWIYSTRAEVVKAKAKILAKDHITEEELLRMGIPLHVLLTAIEELIKDNELEVQLVYKLKR